jgi:hypothetical protein
MTPPNSGGGAGSWLPGIVVVALGEPGVPVICCASVGSPDIVAMATDASRQRRMLFLALIVPSVDNQCEPAVLVGRRCRN